MYHVDSCDIEDWDAPLYTQSVEHLTFPQRDRIENVGDEVEEPNGFLVLLIPESNLHIVTIELRYTIPSHKHDEYGNILEIKQVGLDLATFGDKLNYLTEHSVDTLVIFVFIHKLFVF